MGSCTGNGETIAPSIAALSIERMPSRKMSWMTIAIMEKSILTPFLLKKHESCCLAGLVGKFFV
jgi:hypothetical protein